MIRCFFGLLFGLTIAVAAFGADLEQASKLQRAEETFQQAKTKEDFLKSAAMFQEILDAGIVNSAILYDQGNAFMRAGERGRAIACYRQAKIYSPRDPYLDANLNLAMGMEAIPSTLWDRALFWKGWFGYRETFEWMMISGGLAFGLMMVPVLAPKSRVFRKLALIPLAATLFFALLGAEEWYRFDYRTRGVVTASEVTARKGNAENYDPAFTKPLMEGTEFTVVGRRGDWLQVQLKDGPEGWIPARSSVTF